jgi:hypothetical protein
MCRLRLGVRVEARLHAFPAASLHDTIKGMTSPEEPLASLGDGAALRELERRVLAVEEAVARLEDPRVIEDRIQQRLKELPVAAKAPEPAPSQEIPFATAGPYSLVSIVRWGGAWDRWLLVDMLREGRTLIRLLFDPRYSMAWTTRLVILVVLPIMLTSHWWLAFLLCGFPWNDGLRGVLISAVNLVLAFALYKAMSREVRRYNEQVHR